MTNNQWQGADPVTVKSLLQMNCKAMKSPICSHNMVLSSLHTPVLAVALIIRTAL